MRAPIRGWRLVLAVVPLLFVADTARRVLQPQVMASAPAEVAGVAPARARSTKLPPLAVAPSVVHPVAGYIVDGAGKPIDDVRVTLHGAGDVEARSDAAGEFRLPAEATGTKLTLDAPHVFPAEVGWRGGSPPRIMLARRAHAAVRVVGADGAPVANAEVNLTDGSRPTLATVTTDRDGRARFDDLIPGPYEIWARQDLAVSPLVRVPDVGATSAKEAAIELSLAAGGGISGTVLADGPLPATATIQLVPVDVDHAVRTATLDARGKFAFDGVPAGRWRVGGDVPGYIDDGERIVAPTPGVRSEITLRVERAGVVAGIVVDAEGAPVEHASIVLRRQGVDPRAAETAAPLRSTARLRWVHPLAGKVRIMPIEPGRFGATRPGWRPAECGKGHCGIDLGSIRGQMIHAAADGLVTGVYREIKGEEGRFVVVDHGDGLRTAYLHMHEVRPGLEAGQRVRAGDPLGTIGTTGFALDVPHLHFAITQESGGRSWFVDPEPMLRHAVVLPVPRTFDKIDVDARTLIAATPTTPASAAAVAAAMPPTLATDAAGRFRLENVPPGTYVAVAYAEQLAPGTSPPFTVRTGAETDKVTITLRPGAVVRGRVL
ncbi:MAG: carboxypeptidase regulatory-like domain-containing protein, partial [Deltaproteobacteria bacterium]|nr:carboxypeptidase regulatory-like domain-containing protein [Deltaproteobacteria bacterium]